TRPPRATYRATWSVMTTSTTTAPGVMSLNTATFGIPLRLTLDGLLTAMAIGTGLGRGAGPGLTIRRGALLRSTTAVGRSSAALGVGARARFLARPFMGLRLHVFLAAVSDLELAGFRWALANRSFRGSAAATCSTSCST